MLNNKKVYTTDLAGRKISIETGRLAKQANGSVLVTCGSNTVLVTATARKEPSDMGFFPLTIEYSEKSYSAGRIPGGYFKREGRPTTLATLNARLIDRPLRPSFPEGYQNETQVVATILSHDGTYPVESLASLGASAALSISDIPFGGPTVTLVVGRVNSKWAVNPSPADLEKSDAEFLVAGTPNGILMVEGEAHFIPESEVLAALKFAHEQMKPLFELQLQMKKELGKEKMPFSVYTPDETLLQSYKEYLKPHTVSALAVRDKLERYKKLSEIKDQAVAHFTEGKTEDEAAQVKKDVKIAAEKIKYELARNNVIENSERIDGRKLDEVRSIECEVDLLPRTHGSGLFTRGETQVLGTVTLGTGDDELSIETLSGTIKKRFLLHYNFPPYCVGEVGRMGGQSRREIGHGSLAEMALKNIIPDQKDFPYTVRIVSEVLESNGSSSMGTVCSGTMALLDAGVPIKANVAGIAMGLIKEGDKVAVLTDILGDEDHLGDMDFKVAGTKEGITALQMDIKIDSISFDVMEQALKQAHVGRNHILDCMEKVIAAPKGSISEFAPRIETILIKPDKVRDIIGPGGKVIKSIIEQTGVKLDIEDGGKVHIASTDPKMAQKAKDIIMGICAEAEVGQVYEGKVVKIMDFGALVEVLPNVSGLLHISEIANERVRNVTDVLSEGEEVKVKVVEVDRSGRIRLSRKVLLN